MAGRGSRDRGGHQPSKGRGRGTISASSEGSTPMETEKEHDVEEEEEDEEEEEGQTLTDVGSSSQQTKNLKRDPHLVPGHNWFGKSGVTRFVTDAMKRGYNGPFMNYTSTPKETIDQWFRIFRDLCTWAPEHEPLVRPGFERTVQARLKGTMYEVRKKKKTPTWMTAADFEQVQKKKKDKAFIKKSKIAKANKQKAADADGYLRATHHMGSISTIDYVERAAQKNKGQLPAAPQAFHDMHTRLTPEGDRIFTKKKDKEIYDKFVDKKSRMEKKGEKVSDNAVFYDIVGGHKNGKVYGLGVASNLFYEPPSRNKSSGSITSSLYTPGIYTQLQEEQKARSILEEKLNMQNEAFMKWKEEMEAKFAHLQHNCAPYLPPQNRDSRDPSNDGGGGSNAGVGLEAC